MLPSLIMLHIYDKIPGESLNIVRGKLKKLDKVGLAKIVIGMPALKLHNVGMVFWVGSVILGVFGVGRFMIGDRLLGALKLTLLFLSYILLAVSLALALFPAYASIAVGLMIGGYVGLILCTIWWGVDIFLISTKTKRVNLNKFLMLFTL